jgi:glutaconate CoA-transferase subunit A
LSTNKLISLPDAVRLFAIDGIQYASGAASPVGTDAVVFGALPIQPPRNAREQEHAVCKAAKQQLFSRAFPWHFRGFREARHPVFRG